MISLLALIDSYGPPYFQYPVRTKDYDELGPRDQEYLTLRRRHQDRYFSQFASDNDLEVLLKLWLSLLDFCSNFESIPDYVEGWALQHSINRDKIMEVYSLIADLLKYFDDQEEDTTTTMTSFNPTIFLDQAYPYLENIYQDRLVIPSSNGSNIYLQEGRGFLRASDDYTLSPNPSVPSYALVVSEETDRCLIWVMLSQKQSDQGEEEVEIIVV